MSEDMFSEQTNTENIQDSSAEDATDIQFDVNEADAEDTRDTDNSHTVKHTPENVHKYKSVYNDTLYFVDGMVEQYDFYPEIINVLRDGDATIELKKRYMLKAIDETWVNIIEDTLQAIDEIIRKPSRFIEENEEVLPIELSRNISSRSIKHLSQHTDYISKVEGDEITPSKILNVFRDETMQTYENKFVNTLINRLYIFVHRRYETAKREGKDEKSTSLDYSENFEHGDVRGKVHFRLEIAEDPQDGEKLKNYTYTTDLWHRVEKLHSICTAFINSDFVKGMDKKYIRPPVMRTNAILKNKNLRQCLSLWEFIESYENIGYNMLVQENLETIDDKYIREIYSTTALQYLIFRYNIRNEFEPEPLDSRQTDAPIEPRIIDELTPIEADEFNVFDTRYMRLMPISASARRRRFNKGERLMLEAVDIALEADRIIRNKSQLPKPDTQVDKVRFTPEIALRLLKKEVSDVVKKKELDKKRMRSAAIIATLSAGLGAMLHAVHKKNR